eukprot:210858-Chlamydomonas_euryale.AAC.4
MSLHLFILGVQHVGSGADSGADPPHLLQRAALNLQLPRHLAKHSVAPLRRLPRRRALCSERVCPSRQRRERRVTRCQPRLGVAQPLLRGLCCVRCRRARSRRGGAKFCGCRLDNAEARRQ